METQTFKVGVMAGIPTADAGDVSNFVIGADVYYYFTNIDSFIEIGATAGFRNYFGDEIAPGIEIDDAQFLPLAGAARLKIFGNLSGGLDLGYAIGISDGLDGGFYYRPVLGLDIADTIELTAAYKGLADAAIWGNLSVGVLFEF